MEPDKSVATFNSSARLSRRASTREQSGPSRRESGVNTFDALESNWHSDHSDNVNTSMSNESDENDNLSRYAERKYRRKRELRKLAKSRADRLAKPRRASTPFSLSQHIIQGSGKGKARARDIDSPSPGQHETDERFLSPLPCSLGTANATAGEIEMLASQSALVWKPRPRPANFHRSGKFSRLGSPRLFESDRTLTSSELFDLDSPPLITRLSDARRSEVLLSGFSGNQDASTEHLVDFTLPPPLKEIQAFHDHDDCTDFATEEEQAFLELPPPLIDRTKLWPSQSLSSSMHAAVFNGNFDKNVAEEVSENAKKAEFSAQRLMYPTELPNQLVPASSIAAESSSLFPMVKAVMSSQITSPAVLAAGPTSRHSFTGKPQSISSDQTDSTNLHEHVALPCERLAAVPSENNTHFASPDSQHGRLKDGHPQPCEPFYPPSWSDPGPLSTPGSALGRGSPRGIAKAKQGKGRMLERARINLVSQSSVRRRSLTNDIQPPSQQDDLAKALFPDSPQSLAEPKYTKAMRADQADCVVQTRRLTGGSLNNPVTKGKPARTKRTLSVIDLEPDHTTGQEWQVGVLQASHAVIDELSRPQVKSAMRDAPSELLEKRVKSTPSSSSPPTDSTYLSRLPPDIRAGCEAGNLTRIRQGAKLMCSFLNRL